MPIPGFQPMMHPILEFLSDGALRTNAECRQVIIEKFDITPDEQELLIPSGRAKVLFNRVAWALVHMTKAGLLYRPEAGQCVITDRGRDLLATGIEELSLKTLMRYEEFREFRSRKGSARDQRQVPNEASEDELSENTPEETLDSAYSQIRKELAHDLVAAIKKCSPAFFEQMVVELLVNMGYGGTLKDAGMALGRSGDEGIDGIIKEDRLGLDVIYLQAKRWEGTVGRPEIQRFVGALHGKHARKGVFLTTGEYSQTARDYVRGLDSKVVLIGGQELGELMIDYNIGVSLRAEYLVKKLDSDYFAEG